MTVNKTLPEFHNIFKNFLKTLVLIDKDMFALGMFSLYFVFVFTAQQGIMEISEQKKIQTLRDAP